MSCPSCFSGGRATGTPTGTLETLHSIPTYIALPPASPSPSPSANTPQRTIILYTDAFGHHLPNNLLLADALAQKTHARILVPDIIPGGGMSPSILPLMDTFLSPNAGVWAKTWSLAQAMVHVVPFFVRASPQSEGCKSACLGFARAVRGEMEKGSKLGVAGFCWGGFEGLWVACQSAVEGEEEGKLLDALFVAHPARFEVRQAVRAVEMGVKVSFAHAGDDMALPRGKVEEVRDVLEGRDEFELKVYEGCVHGFAVRATPGKDREAEAADEALEQAVQWFKKWL